MNHRRSRLLPAALAMLVGLILVSAVAYTPGWMSWPKHAATNAVSPTEPAVVHPEPAAPVLPISFAANELVPDTVHATDDVSDPFALGFGFNAADVASPVAQRTVDEDFFSELQQFASAGSAIDSDNGNPIRLAALGGHSIGSLGGGGGGGTGSGDSQRSIGDSATSETSPAVGADSNKHSDHAGQDSTPVGTPSESLPEVPVDAPDTSGTGTTKPDAVPPPTDALEFTPVDPWPTDQLPIGASDAEPVSVPEPGTLGLIALGLAGMAGARRRRSQHGC